MSVPSRASTVDDRHTTSRTLTIPEAFEFAEQQVAALVARAPTRTPAYTHRGRWVLNDDPWAPSWTGGFLAGLMWAIARRSQKPVWRDQAEQATLLLESRKHDTGTHDLGFVLEPSFGRWYDLTGDQHARDVLLQGGQTMAARLQAGGYLSTWVDPGSTFIDIMMNVGIIFRAAKYSGDTALRDTALTHCRTSRRYLVRGDGSTVHEGWFDTTTGEFLRGATHQGWRSDSSWSRGQAWAVYGFTAAYAHTGDDDMLDAAHRAADYYIRHLPIGAVPPNDLVEPAPPQPWESSAAAIAAAGLLHLADAAPEPAAAARYRHHGLAAVRALLSTDFIAASTPGWEGILRHATYHHGNKLGVDESVMWGDYYLIEALELAEPHLDNLKDRP